MNIVKQHIKESIQPVKNEFPLGVKFNALRNRYLFYDWDTGIIMYVYYININHLYKFKNKISMDTGAGILISDNIKNLDDAKDFVLKDWNLTNKVSESIMPEPAFKYRIRRIEPNLTNILPFPLYYQFIDWNTDVLKYIYYTGSKKLIKRTGIRQFDNELIKNNVKDLEQAKEEILKYEGLNEAIMPEKSTLYYVDLYIPYKILDSKEYKKILADNGIEVKYLEANIPSTYTRHTKYIGVKNSLMNLYDFLKSHNLPLTNDRIFFKEKSLLKIKEGLMPIKSTIDDKLKKISPKLSLKYIKANRVFILADDTDTTHKFTSLLARHLHINYKTERVSDDYKGDSQWLITFMGKENLDKILELLQPAKPKEVREGLMPEPNSFPYKLDVRKGNNKDYYFSNYNNLEFNEYAYFIATHNVKRYRTISDTTGIDLGKAKSLEEAKEIMAIDYNRRKELGYIKEGLMPEPNTFPFKIIRSSRYRNVYNFKSWETDQIKYMFNKERNKIWYYENGKAIRIDNSDPNDRLPIRVTPYTMEEAKEVILNHAKENNVIKEAIMPEPNTFPYTMIRNSRNFFFYVNNCEYSNYGYFPASNNVLYYSNERDIDGIKLGKAENVHAAKEIMKAHHNKNKELKESIQPIKQDYPFKIVIKNYRGSIRYLFYKWDDLNTLEYDYEASAKMIIHKIKMNNGVYTWYPLTMSAPDLKQAKELILQHYNKELKKNNTNEAIQPIKQEYPFKIVIKKHNGLFYNFYNWNDLNDMQYQYNGLTKTIVYKLIVCRLDIGNTFIWSVLEDNVSDLEKAKELILQDYRSNNDNSKELKESILPEKNSTEDILKSIHPELELIDVKGDKIIIGSKDSSILDLLEELLRELEINHYIVNDLIEMSKRTLIEYRAILKVSMINIIE